jgi:hypothetical protein
VRRHFAGEIVAVGGPIVRATGFVFIYDDTIAQYVKKASPRTTIADLSESAYIVNLLSSSINIADLRYETVERSYMAVVDGKGFELDANEFGIKR